VRGYYEETLICMPLSGSNGEREMAWVLSRGQERQVPCSNDGDDEEE